MIRQLISRKAAMLIGAVVVVILGCTTTGDATGPRLEVFEDIVYEAHDGEALHLDLVRPAPSGDPRPALIFLHGGGFMGGSKADFAAALRTAAAHDYVAISVQYRLTKPATAAPPRNQFPAALHDVKSAIRWARTHASEYGIDPDRIGVIGFSAGASLALLAAATEPADGLEGPAAPYDVSSAVQAAVAAAPPVDFADPGVNRLTYAIRAHDQYLGGSLEEEPGRYREASPVTWLDLDDAPALVIFGGNDTHIPWSQAERFALAVADHWSPHQVVYAPSAIHDSSTLLTLWLDFPVWDFLEMHLRGE